MNGKIAFGIDFLQILMEVNARSQYQSADALNIARWLLVSDWGLSIDEQDEANTLLWEKYDNRTVDKPATAIERLITHIKVLPEARHKMIKAAFMIGTLSNEKISGSAQEYIYGIASELEIAPAEFDNLYEKAINSLIAFYVVSEQTSNKNIEKYSVVDPIGNYTNIKPEKYYLKKEPDWYWIISPPTVAAEIAVSNLLASERKLIDEEGNLTTVGITTFEIAIREIAVTFGGTNIPLSETDRSPALQPGAKLQEIEGVLRTMPKDLVLELWQNVGQTIPGWGPAKNK